MSTAPEPEPTLDWSASPPDQTTVVYRYGHYRVLLREDGSPWELGRGAMGVTYKAVDENLHAPVALKLIGSEQIGRQQARERFLREARAAAALRHPHVATVYHLGEQDGTIFYAMEFVEGETVEARIRRHGPMPLRSALLITRQVASALAAAQKIGLVHRDIKPANIMLVGENDEVQAKVIDFGLAKQVEGKNEDEVTLTQAGFVGTPHYASPEQLEELELDSRTDVYSLGVTLYYMLCGAPPFAGSLAQVISQHLHRPPPLEPLRDQPPSVVALVEMLLQKDREQRPTAVELLPHLDACLRGLDTPSLASVVAGEQNGFPSLAIKDVESGGETPPPALPPPLPESPQEPSRSRWVWLISWSLAGCVVLALVAGGILRWARQSKSGPVSPPMISATEAQAAPGQESKVEPTQPVSSFAEAMMEARELERLDNPEPALRAYVALLQHYPQEVGPRLGLEKALERLEARAVEPGFTPSEVKQLRPVLQQAAALGFPSADYLLGEMSLPARPTEAASHWRLAGEKNHPEAQARLGWLYASGKLGEPDFAQAVQWLEKAAAAEHPYAMTMLADCYLRGLGVEAANPRRAVELLEAAVQMGENRAMDLLGYLYRRGQGVAQPDLARAFALFHQAAELGNLDAQGNLGIMYLLGESVPSNPAKAISLWREGAEKGNATCMMFYAQSLLDPQFGNDPAAAATWFVKAAQAGNGAAMAWCEREGIDWQNAESPVLPASSPEKPPTEDAASAPPQEPADLPLH